MLTLTKVETTNTVGTWSAAAGTRTAGDHRQMIIVQVENQ
jgi:hypothetical protein